MNIKMFSQSIKAEIIPLKVLQLINAILIVSVLLTSCSKNEIVVEADDELENPVSDADFTPTDWATNSHSKSAAADFEEVFNNTTVKRLDLVITEARWQSMLDDMTELYGTFGSQGGNRPGGGTMELDEDPIFVPAEVFYKGVQWYRVGVRFKGNSSLQSSWQSGILKLSFKLDFDEYEDDYPQINNQRFYGFKKLSLKNNYDDASLLREKVAAEVFAKAGLACSHTAFYTLYVDHGDGPQYFGLYTLVEEVDDTVIDTQYASDDGNLYKPEGTGASFADGTFNADDFTKKNNEDEADWTDIQSLFSVLHDDTRTSDPTTWSSELEKIFDSDVFLKYLAVNTVIQNWDTYGRMTHNYYLYNNPENDKLAWIPWDNNESLQTGKMGGALSLSMNEVNEQWPLIRYLLDVPAYKQKYEEYLRSTVENAFLPDDMITTYNNYYELVKEYAYAEEEGYTFLSSDSDFDRSVDELKSHVQSRKNAVYSYLGL